MNKIPVTRTIAEAYRFTFAGLEKVIGLVWLPVVTLTVGSYFAVGPQLSGLAAAMESGDIGRQGPIMAGMFLFELVCIVLVSVIAVAITREILNPLKRPLFLRFGLGGMEFRLVGAMIGLYVLMIFFILALIALAAALGFFVNSLMPAGPAGLAGPSRGAAFAVLIGLVLSPVLLYIMVRLSFLVAPSVVMEGKYGIERSWRLTKGNFWRIVAISLAVALPILVVSMVAQFAILGPEYFNPHLELLKDQAAQARHSAENMRKLAANLPLLMGANFLLAPFLYGLMFATPAFAYKALTAQAKD
ncbi:MAG: hypothetical protein KGJ78_15080 [Alphaproteobacteria bacterium]|nr:hypothetical protein [Alphaproteobacteria bacterium]